MKMRKVSRFCKIIVEAPGLNASSFFLSKYFEISSFHRTRLGKRCISTWREEIKVLGGRHFFEVNYGACIAVGVMLNAGVANGRRLPYLAVWVAIGAGVAVGFCRMIGAR